MVVEKVESKKYSFFGTKNSTVVMIIYNPKVVKSIEVSTDTTVGDLVSRIFDNKISVQTSKK